MAQGTAPPPCPVAGAPGRTRTCDRPLRRRLLYPLSYGGSALTLANSPSKNGQQLGVLDAAAFRELARQIPR